MNQKEIFLESEGDNWYKRNEGTIDPYSPEILKILQYLKPISNQIGSILEIGCSDGSKTLILGKELDSQINGIDPSNFSISKANAKIQELGLSGNFIQGTADSLPFTDNSIDYIHFGFCLYLIDRELIPSVVSEALRILNFEKGFISIFDFDVTHTYANDYNHLAGVKAFKEDYVAKFLETRNFHLVFKENFSDGKPGLEQNEDNRIAITMLKYKNG